MHKQCVRAPSQERAAPANDVCSDTVRALGHCEREVRAFVEDLCNLHGYHCQENRGADNEWFPHFSAE